MPAQLARLAPWPRLSPPRPPVSLTPILGREPELATARDLLVRREVRLVTLTGPGGVGKTRLAEAAAAAVAPDFPDGVAWISLAAIREAALVPAALVRAFGLGDAGERPPLDLLAAALRDLRILLVLDNLEQVAGAAPDLAALLTACPSVVVLATSRTLLRIRGEHVLPVPPLLTPDPDALDPAGFTSSDAMQLFVVRATAAARGIRFDLAAMRAVAEICRRVDGLPLGIELAAALANLLSPEAIRDRLIQRLPLPGGGVRDLPARQRTLRDAIAWSYELLTPDEQALFRRLAVFSGGFTLDAAERVMGDTDHPSPAGVLDRLGSLVDNSLVFLETAASIGPRYRFLETIREYAADRLEASGEEDAARDAHAGYVVAFAERHEISPFVPYEEREPTAIEVEHDNLDAALAWLDGRDGPLFLRLAAALGWLWWTRGHFIEGRYWLERAVGRDAPFDAAARLKAATALGFIMVGGGGDAAGANAVLADALALARSLDDAAATVQVLIGLGALEGEQGDYEPATSHLRDALVLARGLPDPRAAAILAGDVLAELGVVARARGRLDDAAAHHDEALRLAHEAGSTYNAMHSLADLGDVARDLGDWATAGDRYRESLRLALAYGQARVLCWSLEGIAGVLAAGGDVERAARLFGAAERWRAAAGIVGRPRLDRGAYERTIAAVRSAMDEAAFGDARVAGYGLDPDQAIAEALADPVVVTDHQPAISLTPREREILPLLAAGLTDRAIGEALFIGDRTVQSHVARIFAKLGVRTRAAATSAAVAAGLVAPSPPAPPAG